MLRFWGVGFGGVGTDNLQIKITYMRQLTAVLFVFVLSAGANSLRAQSSLKNTAWKFYVDALHDTLTMHIGVDTSFSTSSTGDLIVRSTYKTVGDTIKIKDVDGQYPCMDGEGVYRYVVDGDSLTFVLVVDPCSNRSGALVDTKFKKTVAK
jgi:hypothetical protein